MVETKPYDTQKLSERVSDLRAEEINIKALELLRVSHPDIAREISSYIAFCAIIHRAPWVVRLSWTGNIRLPLELTVEGKNVRTGQRGVLFDQEGLALAEYLRVIDEAGPGFAASRQEMIVFGNTQIS